MVGLSGATIWFHALPPVVNFLNRTWLLPRHSVHLMIHLCLCLSCLPGWWPSMKSPKLSHSSPHSLFLAILSRVHPYQLKHIIFYACCVHWGLPHQAFLVLLLLFAPVSFTLSLWGLLFLFLPGPANPWAIWSWQCSFAQLRVLNALVIWCLNAWIICHTGWNLQSVGVALGL